MKIVQVVRYVEYCNTAGPGTVALGDDGRLYRIFEHGAAAKWVETPLPALPSTTLTLKPKAK